MSAALSRGQTVITLKAHEVSKHKSRLILMMSHACIFVDYVKENKQPVDDVVSLTTGSLAKECVHNPQEVCG